MIVKDDLYKVDHSVTSSDPNGPRYKRGHLRPIGQPARVKHAGNPANTQLISAIRRLTGNSIAAVPLLSYTILKLG
jgi:hypothetical protein